MLRPAQTCSDYTKNHEVRHWQSLCIWLIDVCIKMAQKMQTLIVTFDEKVSKEVTLEDTGHPKLCVLQTQMKSLLVKIQKF